MSSWTNSKSKNLENLTILQNRGVVYLNEPRQKSIIFTRSNSTSSLERTKNKD